MRLRSSYLDKPSNCLYIGELHYPYLQDFLAVIDILNNPATLSNIVSRKCCLDFNRSPFLVVFRRLLVLDSEFILRRDR